MSAHDVQASFHRRERAGGRANQRARPLAGRPFRHSGPGHSGAPRPGLFVPRMGPAVRRACQMPGPHVASGRLGEREMQLGWRRGRWRRRHSRATRGRQRSTPGWATHNTVASGISWFVYLKPGRRDVEGRRGCAGARPSRGQVPSSPVPRVGGGKAENKTNEMAVVSEGQAMEARPKGGCAVRAGSDGMMG